MVEHSPGKFRVAEQARETDDLLIKDSDGRIVGEAFGCSIEQRAANARLYAASPDLLTACDDAARWLGGESDLEHYETIAEWFHADTGLMRPGKDVPAGLDDAQDRHAAFCEWAEAKRHKINADLRSAIAKARGQ